MRTTIASTPVVHSALRAQDIKQLMDETIRILPIGAIIGEDGPLIIDFSGMICIARVEEDGLCGPTAESSFQSSNFQIVHPAFLGSIAY